MTTENIQTRALPVVTEASSGACCGDDCCGGNATQIVAAPLSAQNITEAVRERYGKVALNVLEGNTNSGCCDTSCCDDSAADGITGNLYTIDELDGLPLKAQLASLGCGNPTALAELHAGEKVLDLGSGGGIDVLLSARRVGTSGFAYGLDMTDSMRELAQRNAAEAGATNVMFLKGDIASIPLPTNSVDVIISNCVINLAANKTPVLREAFRVLKPGGRFAVSDIVIHGGLPADVGNNAAMRRDLSSWSGCIAGALTDAEYRQGLADVGFENIDLEITRRYSPADLGDALPQWVAQRGEEIPHAVVSRFAATFVRATKPGL